MRNPQLFEEYAYVLDFLPHGRPRMRGRFRAGSIVQALGEEYFTLLEAAVKEGEVLKPQERIYVGKKFRSKITYIIGRIRYEDLTSAAQMELPVAVERIVKEREDWFVNFFNTAQAITPRMHALELIPGIGKKYMWQIIEEREKEPFKDFEDIKRRVNLPNPVKLLVRRILEEISGESKYHLFTRPG